MLLIMQTFYKTRQDKNNLQSQLKGPRLNNTKIYTAAMWRFRLMFTHFRIS